jgi:alpha-tubulin suppressor-like RCC1 family protein
VTKKSFVYIFSRSPKVFRTRDVSITLDHTTRGHDPSFWRSQGSSSKLVVVLHKAPSLVTFENHISSFAQLRVSRSNELTFLFTMPHRSVLSVLLLALLSLSVEGASIALGDSHSCALQTGGEIKCWGSNNHGQLGDGTTDGSTNPVEVSGITTATSLAVGPAYFFSCALLKDGKVMCWGYNNVGQLGDSTTNDRYTAVEVVGITRATSIALGSSNACALLQDGKIKCWGENGNGQLGDTTTTSYRSTPAEVDGIMTAISVALGTSQACALLANSTVICWGYNYGTSPEEVFGITTATSIALGEGHFCAVLTDGTMKCWGENSRGQLGDGTTTHRSTLVEVDGIKTAISVALGYRHSCAILTDGKVSCWGENEYGQLGDGTTTDRYTAVNVSNISTATSIAMGGWHSCALLTDGKMTCWGIGGEGRLGDGTHNTRYTPVEVIGLLVPPPSNTMNVIALGGDHSCALLMGGTVKCWGSNDNGQLGDGTTTPSVTPVDVSGITTATSIALGYYSHSCAVLTGGKVKCWGYNANGQLGDGTTTSRTTPVEVSGIKTATSIALGSEHSCAILEGGNVMCWGNGENGELGNDNHDESYIPVEVSRITNATSISLGGSHSCALLTGGKIKCWGSNLQGELGSKRINEAGDAIENFDAPIEVSNITMATSISLGGSHSCALLTDATVVCWGYNGNGQLGDGTTDDRFTPVGVSGITNATSISLGGSHSCALLTDATVVCWGYNGNGQLGDGTTDDIWTPVKVDGITTATSISLGGHSCAVLTDSTVLCWGENNSTSFAESRVARPVSLWRV